MSSAGRARRTFRAVRRNLTIGPTRPPQTIRRQDTRAHRRQTVSTRWRGGAGHASVWGKSDLWRARGRSATPESTAGCVWSRSNRLGTVTPPRGRFLGCHCLAVTVNAGGIPCRARRHRRCRCPPSPPTVFSCTSVCSRPGPRPCRKPCAPPNQHWPRPACCSAVRPPGSGRACWVSCVRRRPTARGRNSRNQFIRTRIGSWSAVRTCAVPVPRRPRPSSHGSAVTVASLCSSPSGRCQGCWRPPGSNC